MTMLDRASALDMMELATDVGPAPMQVGAILVFEPGAGPDAREVRETLAARVSGIPRLRQRLRFGPPGCGRPVWVDDSRFALDQHLDEVRCPAPGDEAALLSVAADVVTRPLPAGHSGQPPWSPGWPSRPAPSSSCSITCWPMAWADWQCWRT